MEALASGTPVVLPDRGVFPELVAFDKVNCSGHPERPSTKSSAQAALSGVEGRSRRVGLTGGGLLVPADDPEALAEALRELRDDPDRADRLGEAGAAGVREHFSLDVMVSRMLEVYETVLSGGPPAGGSIAQATVSLSNGGKEARGQQDPP